VADLPVSVDELSTWAECLAPAGFREGLGVALVEPGGVHVGFLGLLYTSSEPPSTVTRRRLGELAPIVARGLSPMRSLLASARIVPGAQAGVVLLRDGSTCLLPGLPGHPLLQTGSPWWRSPEAAFSPAMSTGPSCGPPPTLDEPVLTSG
jgi:hypothetical protein